MRAASTVVSALPEIAFLRMLLPAPIHAAYWRVLVAALAGAAVAAGIAAVADGMKTRRLARRLKR